MAKIRVLVVDDELDFLELMHARLEDWGYDSIRVTRGNEAIEVIKQAQADIVVLDYRLPDMNGLEVLKQLRKLDKNIPVFIYTAHPDIKEIKELEALGISAFMSKLSHCTDTAEALKSALDIVTRKVND